jgi:hypothetical protein
MALKTSKKLVAAAVVAIGSFIVAPAAYAGLTNQSYSTTLPNLQQPRHVGNQTKTYGSTAGNIYVANVGADYRVNARMHHSPSRSYGTEIFGLGDGSSGRLANSYAAGTTQLQATLVNSTWTAVTVSVNGHWRSN